MPLRVLDAQGVGNMWVLAEALQYAMDPDGDPASDDGADVINMSLATVHDSRLMHDLVGEACDDDLAAPAPSPTPSGPNAGAVVVTAAGNRGTSQKMYPAAENVDGSLSVGSSRQDDTLSAFSQREWVRVMAPGEGILSSVPEGGMAAWAGTSMASPLVAGQAALVRAAFPDLTAPQVTDRIRETSVRTDEAISRRVDAAASIVPFATSTANPIDRTPDFVRQQYLDFLNRAPDASGEAFWRKGIEDCGPDAQCAQVTRINTSGAFFLSIEFRDTGYFVYRLHKAAYGDLPGKPVPVRYEVFMPDTQAIGEGVIVHAPGWQQKLDANREAFLSSFVTRQQFRAAFPAGTSAAAFVDRLFANASVRPSAAERQALVSELASDPDSPQLRASVLKRVAENTALLEQERNRAFVLMQYFGYLRRNPDGGQDTDFSGYNHWLTNLEKFGGNFVQAELVKAFIESIEYRQRFRQ